MGLILTFGPILIILLVLLAGGGIKRGKCSICGKAGRAFTLSAYVTVTKYSTGDIVRTTNAFKKKISGIEEEQFVCSNCFQKEILDKQGTCPHCNKPMIIGEDTFQQYIVDNKWYHKTCLRRMSILAQQHPAIEKTTTKEVVIKVRCQYCSNVFDETLDKCPYCGGKR